MSGKADSAERLDRRHVPGFLLRFHSGARRLCRTTWRTAELPHLLGEPAMSRLTRLASTVVAAAAIGSAFAPAVATAAATSPKSLTLAYLRDGDVYVGAGGAAHRLTTDKHSSRP